MDNSPLPEGFEFDERVAPDAWAQRMREILIADCERISAKQGEPLASTLRPLIERHKAYVGTQGINMTKHRRAVEYAVREGDPVSAAAAAFYGITLPGYYVHKGDLCSVPAGRKGEHGEQTAAA